MGIGTAVILVLVTAFIASLIRNYRRLKQERDFSSSILEAAGAYFIVLDKNYKIIRFNKTCEQLTGLNSDDILGTDIKKIKLLPDIFIDAMPESETEPENSSGIEHEWISSTGKHVINWSATFLKDESKNVKWIICTGIDITERKRLQKQLSSAQRLETAGRVAGQIAHDFNNLLSPITAYPEVIRQELPDKSTIIPLLNEMEISANRIAEINQQLLALGRRGHYIAKPVDIHNLIDEVLTSLRFSSDILVRKNYNADRFFIIGGKAQLVRALTNLLINAIEAISDTGEIEIKTTNITLNKQLNGYKTVDPGEYLKLEITDNGIGIEANDIDKIYDPFFTTKTMDKRSGSGLGLSVVHGIIHDHQGYIQVNSTRGVGTTFSLYLPVAKESDRRLPSIIDKKHGNNETILVIDDDETQRNVARQLLQRLGYNVQTVENGHKAVEYLKSNKIDLIIIDMVMESMDGVETYKKILEVQPGQKAVILSGHAMSNRVQEALELGANSFVSKPITPDSLATAIQKALQDHKKPELQG